MIKKVIFIIFAIIFFCVDICIQSNYNYDVTKIIIKEKYTYEDLIKKYTSDVFDNIVDKNYTAIYDMFEKGVFKDISEFEAFLKQNFAEEGNLATPDTVKKLGKNIYEVKVRIEPPLFTSYEKMKLEQYKKKYFNLKIQLDGLFNYKILEFKKI